MSNFPSFRGLLLCLIVLLFVNTGWSAEEVETMSPVLARQQLTEAQSLEHTDLVGKELTQALQQAESLYRQIVEAEVPEGLRSDAGFGRARVLDRLNKPWQAHLAVEASYPKRFDAKGVRERVNLQYKLAKDLMALGDKEIGSETGDEKKLTGVHAASIVFGALVYNDPHCPYAPRALLLQGDCLIRSGSQEEAEEAYRKLIKYYPKSKEAMYAYAGAALAIVDRDWKGGLPREKAQEVEQLLLECHAARKTDPELEQRIQRVEGVRDESFAADRLKKARFHLRRGSKPDRQAAIFILQDIAKRFPHSPSAETAREELVRLGVSAEKEEE